MNLHVFSEDVGSSSIRAKGLDDNFRRVRPLQRDGTARQYAINETPDGWSIEIFLQELIQQQLPPPTSGTWVLGAVNGSVQWIATSECA
jgi:hypothetical protein